MDLTLSPTDGTAANRQIYPAILNLTPCLPADPAAVRPGSQRRARTPDDERLDSGASHLTQGRLGTGRPGTPGIDRHLDQPTATFSRQSRRSEPQDHTNRYTVTMSDGRGQAERAQSRLRYV